MKDDIQMAVEIQGRRGGPVGEGEHVQIKHQ